MPLELQLYATGAVLRRTRKVQPANCNATKARELQSRRRNHVILSPLPRLQSLNEETMKRSVKGALYVRP